MHLFHCWHKVEDSERKIKSNRKCKNAHEYISSGFFEGHPHVKYTITEKCCICDKERESEVYKDYDIGRALSYKSK